MKVVHKHRITLDERQSKIYIDVSQGDDKTRILELSLYSGGQPWGVPDGVSVAVAYSGPGGKGIYDTLPDGSAACAVAGNVVTATVIPQALAMHGNVQLALVFTDGNGKQLSTFCVTFRVAASPAAGAVKPKPYFNIRQWVDKNVADLVEKLQTVYIMVYANDDGSFFTSTQAADILAAYQSGRELFCVVPVNGQQVRLPLLSVQENGMRLILNFGGTGAWLTGDEVCTVSAQLDVADGAVAVKVQVSQGGGDGVSGVTTGDNDTADFAISDEDGNVILILSGGHIQTKNFDSANINPNRDLKILFIGNSLTQDAVCYLPLLLDEIAPDVKYTIYDWYNAGANLPQQYARFTNGTNCEIFGTITNSQNGGWDVKNNAVNMEWVCQNCDFGIVVIQEYSYYSYADDVEIANFNSIVDYIKTNRQKPFKVFSLVDAPMRSRPDDYARAKHYAQLHYENTICEGIVNPGSAVVYALSNDILKDLGDMGGLTPDGTHTQEGLPCMLQSYVLALWLFSLMDIPKSIYNSQTRMTQEFYDSWQTIGANIGSGVVEGTEEQYSEAQKLAIKAYKFSQKLMLDSINGMEEV